MRPIAWPLFVVPSARLAATSAAAALGALCLVTILGLAAPASAQDEPAGALQLHGLLSPDADAGAAVSADLWFPLDVLRLGGFIGVGTVPSEDDARNRVFMPVGASVGLELLGDVIGVSLRARGGLWAGATQEVKLTAGGFVGGAAYLLFHLGSGVALSVGADAWGLFGAGETALFALGAGITWNPAFEEDE